MAIPDTLARGIRDRFDREVATLFIGWLDFIDEAVRRGRLLRVIRRPPPAVCAALGDDVVDDLIGWMIAVRTAPH